LPEFPNPKVFVELAVGVPKSPVLAAVFAPNNPPDWFEVAPKPSQTNKHETRGPRGPWVAHQRKRSKVTVELIIENPRGII